MLASAATLILLAATAAAQSSQTTLCVAGQCLQGSSNISIGAVVAGKGQLVLLPGTYSSTSEPQSLRDSLTLPTSRLSYAPGFGPVNSTTTPTDGSISLPLNIALQPGVLSTTASLYRGQTQFHPVPVTNTTLNTTAPPVTFPAGSSIVMSPNVWTTFKSGNSRLVVWESVPDMLQLPTGLGSSPLTMLDLQSSTCSTPCAGNGVCAPSGKCLCPSGFVGDSCESCADGFYGPQCLPCPEDCTTCDDGATGSGKCLVPKVDNAPSTCNCVNGLCSPDGTCQCNDGWQDAQNGTKCASCASGFFLKQDGSCAACSNGCQTCADGDGACTRCGDGLVTDLNDPTSCTIGNRATAQGCAPNEFVLNGLCTACSQDCASCTGPQDNDCHVCAGNTFKLNGFCVAADSHGLCTGSKRFANVNKGTCDTCPIGCTGCNFPSFSADHNPDHLQCTACLPGFVLFNGTCASTCPAGTFNDGTTCTTCDASCATCAGDAKFCLSCAGSNLAASGTCGTTCPTGTFKSDGACLPCHGDCATCSGAGFDQCETCSAVRPVLISKGSTTSGRCLPTCAKNQYFDATANKCQTCDASCSSCAGAGSTQCLACSGPQQVLLSGRCVDATCQNGSGVVPGLGVCLSTLVAAPYVDNTPVAITPTPDPAPVASVRRLAWWEILLMVLGCVFIFVLFLMCWRRRARQKRAAQTAAFATNIKSRGFFSRGAHWLGDKLFHSRVQDTDVERMIDRMKSAEKARHKHEMELLEARIREGSKTERSTPSLRSEPAYYNEWDARSRVASPQPSIHGSAHRDVAPHVLNRLSTPSLYSTVTGVPRRVPVPREPMHEVDLFDMRSQHRSRFSASTTGTSFWRTPAHVPALPEPEPSWESQPVLSYRTGESFESTHSHTSTGENRNPFRR